jgi:WD40 repeat protein
MMRFPEGILSTTISWRQMLRMLAVSVAISCGNGEGQAQDTTPELPTEPILRIETGQHIAQIKGIDTDAANRYAVTASIDKTARVWSLSDGRLLRVLRLPIDQGNIGKAYAVALTPDGSTVAVAGRSAAGAHQDIFLFDLVGQGADGRQNRSAPVRLSGELKQRLSDLPNVVNHLAYSPDGRRLAACMGGANGIRVFDVGGGYRTLPSDAHYNDSSNWAAFDKSGRLVTTSDDGFVRLYAADSYEIPIARFRTPEHDPYSAAFSPDGTRVAVGYYDTKNVVVLSGDNLKELFKPNTTGVPDVGLEAVAWSEDGRFLFAGGFWVVQNVSRVRRWTDSGRGAFVDITSGSDTILQILGLKEGRMLFASLGDFGLIQTSTSPVWIQRLGALHLNSGRGPLRISADGETVQVDSLDPLHTYRYALSQRQIDVDPATGASLLGPVTEASGLAVRNWKNSRAPTVNGTLLKLEPYEMSRSLAVVPATEHFVLGTEWSLRLFDRDAHEVWAARPVSDSAWHVNITADGRLIVAAFGDGTIRWSRVLDGQEVLALFIHPDGQRWITWTPQATTMLRSAPTT